MRILPILLVAAGCGSEPSSTTPDPATDSATDPTGTATGTTASDPWPHLAQVALPDSMAGYTMESGEEILDVGLAFYADHPDEYDFLVAYFEEEVAGLFAFALPLAHDIEGIGQQEVMELYGWEDLDPGDAGSAGRLQQIMMMNAPAVYTGTLYTPQDILIHEVGHRWSANLRVEGPDPWVLTDTWYSHWSVYANVGGPSAEGYGQLVDQGDGRFAYEIVTPLAYSDLELYQQGLLGADEVRPMFTVSDAHDFDPPDNLGQPWDDGAYGSPVRYAATRSELSIDDIVAVHGPRVPAHGDAPTAFRFAFVVVCTRACDAEVLDWVEAQRVAFPASFAAATRGLGSASTEL